MAGSASFKSPYEIVGLASSAGGVHALQVVVAGLPADFPVPLVIVQHLDPHHDSLLTEVLGRRTKLPVQQAHSDDKISAGNIYIAPPNRHVVMTSKLTISLVDTEKVHFVRPSADVLFESMAEWCGQGSIAVILTGTGVDGSMGIAAVKGSGGIVVAQDEKSSEFFGMPGAAIQTGLVDYVVPLDDVAATLVSLVQGRTP